MATKRWLLAAEADKIQDFLFRSARLREVVGGSQLLSRFCQKVPELLLGKARADHDVVVSDGGSFRVIFDTRDEALMFGEQLAEVYRLAADGSLSIARPVEFADGEFPHASEVAEQFLREAKRHPLRAAATIHIPYIALCTSCGVGLAVTYEHIPGERRGRLLCAACRNKTLESWEMQDDQFMSPFLKKAVPGYEKKLTYPGSERRPDTNEFDPTTDIGDYDARNYIAYLLADGNGMGEIFGKCNKTQMRQLSTGMTETLRECLATAAITLRKNQEKIDLDVPILPLIIGGDDLFALIPAPWAVHFAAIFCEAYENQVTALVQRVFGDTSDHPQKMTCGAAVVLCKSSYPYRLAHEAGEQRLKQIKRMSKVLAHRHGTQHSVIDMEIIIGSQLTQPSSEEEYRPTLRPYWIGNPPEGWGLPVENLLKARFQLRRLPGKRQEQLRALYQSDRLPKKAADLEEWKAERDALLHRIGLDTLLDADDYTPEQRMANVWSLLDGVEFNKITRFTDHETWYGHALPDVLEGWDFLLDMNEPSAKYEEA